MHRLLSLRNETVPLSLITNFLETSKPTLAQPQPPLSKLSIPAPRSRSSSTAAATPIPEETRIKRETPSIESSPAPIPLHPYVASLQDLPTHKRIEELRKLHQTLPIYIEAEEQRLQQELAEKQEAEELARQRREKQEQIEKLQRELEEISRQEQRSLGRT